MSKPAPGTKPILINGEIRYVPVSALARRRPATATEEDDGNDLDDDRKGRPLVVRQQPWYQKYRVYIYAVGTLALFSLALKAGPRYGVLLLIVAGFAVVSNSSSCSVGLDDNVKGITTQKVSRVSSVRMYIYCDLFQNLRGYTVTSSELLSQFALRTFADFCQS